CVLIFGVLAHKELGRFPRKATNVAREIILTPLKDKRSARGAGLLGPFNVVCSAGGRKRASIRVVPGMGEAVRTAEKLLEPQDTLLILGSHLTVEEAAGYL
ncbi:MAG: hypothetical protein KAX38_05795, partial [Candidatus Krumholzibacteria bacterium]|nr:hypothetical protein [Candidatus Krumholzibacteria bacterium]